MPLSTFVSAVMETGLNRLLLLDPEIKQALTPLIGKVLSIELTGVVAPRYLCFHAGGIELLADMGEAADCSLCLSPSVLPLLRDSSQLSDLIKNDKLHIHGDIKVAQQFSDLLMQLNIDIEELLSHKLGDPAAHLLVYQSKKIVGLAREKASQLKQDWAEVAIHEWRVGPGKTELHCWHQDLLALVRDLDAIELRVAALEQGAINIDENNANDPE